VLSIPNKTFGTKKNFRKYKGSKIQDPFMPRIQASTINHFDSAEGEAPNAQWLGSP
jgi:hypothetical protein